MRGQAGPPARVRGEPAVPVDRGYGVRTVRRPLLTTGRFPDRRLRLLFASTGTACLSPRDGPPVPGGDRPLLPLEHTLAACSPSGGGVYVMWTRPWPVLAGSLFGLDA